MFKNFLFIIGKHKGYFFRLAVIGVIANSIVTVLNPLVIKYIFDEGIIKGNFRSFILISIGFMLLATVFRLFNMFYSISIQKMKNSISKDMIVSMVNKFYEMPYIKVVEKNTGYYTSRVYDESVNAVNSSIDLATEMLESIVISVVSVVMVIIISFKASLYLAIAIPFLMIISNKYQKRIKHFSHSEKESESEVKGVVTKALQSYRSAKIFNLIQNVILKINQQMDKYNSNIYHRVKNTMTYNTVSSILMSYVEISVIIVCGYQIFKGRMTFGDFMGFTNAFWAAVGGIRVLLTKIPDISKVNAYIERLKEFDESGKDIYLNRKISADEVTFNNVSFGFSKKDVLSDFNLDIKKGEKVIISGKNGSGKSTIANIICGFLNPKKGKVSSPDINEISALIMPHNFIPGSFKDNIFSLKDMDTDYSSKLLNDFELTECLDKNPDDLSAGQRKKAEIIMTLLKDSDFYIFDEPLANVDIESKEIIMSQIFDRTKDKTLIVIMHGDEKFKTRFDKVVEL